MRYGHYLVSSESYALILCISLQAMDLQHTFIIFGAQGFAMIMFSLLKQVIKAPRPFFIDTDIAVDSCKYAEFGSPSGHSFAAGVIYTNLTVLLLKYYKCSRRTGLLCYALITVPTLAFLGFSRIYEGMHSVDQVVSGISQGVLSGYLFSEVLYTYLIELQEQASYRPLFKTLIGNFFSVVLMIGGIANIVAYSINARTYSIPQTWL